MSPKVRVGPTLPCPVRFDGKALYAAIVAKADGMKPKISMREACRQAGAPSPNTISRLATGGSCDTQSLAALLHWLGTTDLAPFIRTINTPEATDGR